MGKPSTRKKSNKRSESKPQVPDSMGSSSSSSSPVRRRLVLLIAILLVACVLVPLSISSDAFGSSKGDASPSNRLYTVEVVNEFPHDHSAFTQGLLYAGNDTLFESTGLYGQSSVREVNLKSGKVKAIHKMLRTDFGEGLTLLGERLIQVTWLKKTGYIYDKDNLNKVSVFTHHMQDGWGLATDGNVLFGVDGTSTLYQMDPQTFEVTQKHIVKYDEHEVPSLNELEYINGEVWANVWQTDCIARISPENGHVHSWVLLHKLREGLVAAGFRGFDVLNGIAWDKDNDRLFVSGKMWPRLYEIKLQPVKIPFNEDIEKLCIPPPVHF